MTFSRPAAPPARRPKHFGRQGPSASLSPSWPTVVVDAQLEAFCCRIMNQYLIAASVFALFRTDARIWQVVRGVRQVGIIGETWRAHKVSATAPASGLFSCLPALTTYSPRG